jgi:ATP-dependent DNA helicase RecG
MDRDELEQLVRHGETETIEFKKSSAQLRRAMETLCGMLNGAGGRVLIGITPEGCIVGQTVSDKTLRELADFLRRFEPMATILQTNVSIGDDKDMLVLEACPDPTQRPYVFEGRPYQRIGPTTSVMPQENYHRLLAERPDSRTRWEPGL